MQKSKPILTQAQLHKLLRYDAETGEFTWVNTRKSTYIGKTAGCIDVTNGYIKLSINDRGYLGHRIAWQMFYGITPKHQIDHINGVRSDNRICNLREATTSENMMNTSISLKNTSGAKGVSWDKSRNKWRASGGLNGKIITIGRFIQKIDADLAYQSFAKEHDGKFYRAPTENIACIGL